MNYDTTLKELDNWLQTLNDMETVMTENRDWLKKQVDSLGKKNKSC